MQTYRRFSDDIDPQERLTDEEDNRIRSKKKIKTFCKPEPEVKSNSSLGSQDARNFVTEVIKTNSEKMKNRAIPEKPEI